MWTFGDLFNSIGTVLTHLVAMGVGSLIERLRVWLKNHLLSGQRALLFGFENPTMIVYPPRNGEKLPDEPHKILPVISTEDFLAINNIISTFIKCQMERPVKLRDTEQFQPIFKREYNLVLICSSKTNSVTREALQELRAIYDDDKIPKFEVGSDNKVTLHLHRGEYPSPSYGQDLHGGQTIEDIAVIVKTDNPWNRQRKMLIIAGTRGIGTWGAAETLKKMWQDIYEKKGSKLFGKLSKRGNFVALIKIRYKDHDILNETTLLNLVDL